MQIDPLIVALVCALVVVLAFALVRERSRTKQTKIILQNDFRDTLLLMVQEIRKNESTGLKNLFNGMEEIGAEASDIIGQYCRLSSISSAVYDLGKYTKKFEEYAGQKPPNYDSMKAMLDRSDQRDISLYIQYGDRWIKFVRNGKTGNYEVIHQINYVVVTSR